jgi:hypothetical protein
MAAPSPSGTWLSFLHSSYLHHTHTQGVTLPPLIRSLKLAGAAGPTCEELEARRIVIEAAVSYLQKARERQQGISRDL